MGPPLTTQQPHESDPRAFHGSRSSLPPYPDPDFFQPAAQGGDQRNGEQGPINADRSRSRAASRRPSATTLPPQAVAQCRRPSAARVSIQTRGRVILTGLVSTTEPCPQACRLGAVEDLRELSGLLTIWSRAFLARRLP